VNLEMLIVEHSPDEIQPAANIRGKVWLSTGSGLVVLSPGTRLRVVAGSMRLDPDGSETSPCCFEAGSEGSILCVEEDENGPRD